MLSDRDIKKELVKAKNLAIYPLKLENINGSSINLSASKYAWRIIDKKSAVKGQKIIIPAKQTVSMLTEETLWVSRKISGTYHSRVSLAAKGLSNVSTTLDPQWRGKSIITITNHARRSIEILIGDGIVTLTLDYMNKRATKEINETIPNRTDLYSKFEMAPEDRNYLTSTEHRSIVRIKKNMKASPDYSELKDSTLKTKCIYYLSQPLMTTIITSISGIGGIVLGWFLENWITK